MEEQKLHVEMWDINKLVAYARNPRKNDDVVPRMKASIREFGFRIPIVAKSDGTVVDGHLRLKAARELGMKEVPVALADELSPTQVKAFRLLANQSANWAEWDSDLLKLEVEDLKLEDFDVDLIGLEKSLTIEEKEDGSKELYDKYSVKMGEVIYPPKDTHHKPSELFSENDSQDINDCIAKIKDDTIRRLCEVRRAWLCNFYYDKIADYYAYQADKEEQEAFEKLALVLLDKDKLIEKGYSRLVEQVDKNWEDIEHE